MMKPTKRTTIQVSQDCKDALAALGNKGDTYEDILRKLMKTVYDWDNVHKISVPFCTDKSIQYMDVIIPKVDAMHIDEDEFRDCIGKICEDNNIRILEASEVPYFNNDHF